MTTHTHPGGPFEQIALHDEQLGRDADVRIATRHFSLAALLRYKCPVKKPHALYGFTLRRRVKLLC
jgi:hypothetical protein